MRICPGTFRFYLGAVALIAAFAAATAFVSADSRAAPDWRAANLERIVTADREASKVESVIFGAWIGDKPLLTVAQGELVTGVPATTAAHIRPGIVQTEALATILVQLADRKRVALDAPLSRWFPDLPRAGSVTLRMLADSRSGYGDFLHDPAFSNELLTDPFRTFAPERLIAIGMRQPMPFGPGKGFFYSHTNAVLLGAALQRITGKSVAELMQERIFGPLHLNESSIPSSADVQAPAQHVFLRERGPYEDSTYWNPSWASYSGSIVSTIHDVAVMQRALGSGVFVSKAGFAAIVAPTNATKSMPDYYYGLGVIVAGKWIVQHAQVAGSDVVMAYLPARDLTLVVSTATSFASVPRPTGYSALFLKDAAAYLAPELPIPPYFFGTGNG